MSTSSRILSVRRVSDGSGILVFALTSTKVNKSYMDTYQPQAGGNYINSLPPSYLPHHG